MAKKKNPAAVALGRRGGKARLKKMSDERRREIASAAGRASGEARRAKAKNTDKRTKLPRGKS
jgi:hypothetical protein